MSITSQQLDAIIAAGNANILDRDLATAILGGTVQQPERRVRTSQTANTPATKRAKARKAQQPKAEVRPTRKATPKAVKADDWRSRPMSRKQRDRIVKVSDEHGFEILDMTGWTAGVASTYYNDLKAAI